MLGRKARDGSRQSRTDPSACPGNEDPFATKRSGCLSLIDGQLFALKKALPFAVHQIGSGASGRVLKAHQL